LRESTGVSEITVFTGNGRLVAFSSSNFGQLLPDQPPPNVMNQLRVSREYSAAEAVDPVPAAEARDVVGAAGVLRLREVVPIDSRHRYLPMLGVSPDTRGVQGLEPVPDRIDG